MRLNVSSDAVNANGARLKRGETDKNSKKPMNQEGADMENAYYTDVASLQSRYLTHMPSVSRCDQILLGPKIFADWAVM